MSSGRESVRPCREPHRRGVGHAVRLGLAPARKPQARLYRSATNPPAAGRCSPCCSSSARPAPPDSSVKFFLTFQESWRKNSMFQAHEVSAGSRAVPDKACARRPRARSPNSSPVRPRCPSSNPGRTDLHGVVLEVLVLAPALHPAAGLYRVGVHHLGEAVTDPQEAVVREDVVHVLGEPQALRVSVELHDQVGDDAVSEPPNGFWRPLLPRWVAELHLRRVVEPVVVLEAAPGEDELVGAGRSRAPQVRLIQTAETPVSVQVDRCGQLDVARTPTTGRGRSGFLSSAVPGQPDDRAGVLSVML